MASRFAEIDEYGIQDLMDCSENENTRKSTSYWLNVFRKFGQPQGTSDSA